MRRNQDILRDQRSPYSHVHRMPSPEQHFAREALTRQNSHNPATKSHETILKQKRIVLEPGTPCEPLEEILACTKIVENNVTTYLLSKALRGPLLELASKAPPPPAMGPKELPKTDEPLSGELTPHLPSYAVTTHEGVVRP